MTDRNDRTARANDFAFIQEDPFIALDLLRLICGKKIGEGAYRAVYEHGLIRSSVIKVTVHPRSNVLEYEMWQAVIGTPYAKWFAPCIYISPGGHFLIQKRCRPIKSTDKLPKTLPDAFDDIKKSNFGFIGKQLVCHDYQFLSRLIDCAFVTKRNVTWKY